MAITLAPHYTQRTYRWTAWKTACTVRSGHHQYDEDSLTYTIYFYDGPEVHITTLWKTEVPYTVITEYSQEQNDLDKGDFESSYLSQANKPLEPRNAIGNLCVSSEPRVGSEVIYGTHNFSDPTTWFAESVRVVDALATNTGNGLIWQLAHPNVIDLEHGKIFDEDQYKLDQQADNPTDPHAYVVIVKVNDNIQTMREVFMTSGGDYVVNYLEGKIEFFADQTGNTVEVSYSYANGSGFWITPDSGFNLNIEKAKASFSLDFEMNDTILFIIYGYAAVFAPQLGLPAGTRIPIAQTRYKTFTQIRTEAAEITKATSAGITARGTSQDCHSLWFRYGTTRLLHSMYGISLCIRQEHDIPNGGEYTNATFYCVVKPEV